MGSVDMISQEEAGRFWTSLLGILPRLERDLEDEEALLELDDAVARLGGFGWEVGPGVAREFLFALSVGLDRALYSRARGLMRRAPPLPMWDLLPALPPKQWDGSLSWGDPPFTYDTRRWGYTLARSKDGSVALRVHASELASHSPEERSQIVALVASSWAGEQLILETLTDIEACVEAAARSIALPMLQRHLTDLRT